MEAAEPKRKQAAPKTERMPERNERPAPRRTEASVDVSIEEVEDAEALFAEPPHHARYVDDPGSDPVVESSMGSDPDLEDPFDDTRNGMPRVPSAYASQPLPLMHATSHAANQAAAPRISTALGLGPAGLPPVQQMQPPMQMQQPMQMPQATQQSMLGMQVPSGSQPIPLQSAQLQALRMQAMQQLQQMQMQSAQMQSAQMQSAQMQPAQMQQAAQPYMVLNGVSGASGPVLTPGLNQVRPVMAKGTESKVVHRAPWFCLGLMVGVAAMVAAFFMPASRDGRDGTSVEGPKAQAAVQYPQQAQQPMAGAAQQQFGAPLGQPQSPPQQMVPPQQMGPQMGAPPQSMGTPPQMTPPAPQAAAAAKPMPTVDVRTLPIAGQKTSQAAPVRRAPARAQAPARRPAAAPKPQPLADDDDAPAPAPKAATPAPSDTVNPDTFLQAL